MKNPVYGPESHIRQLIRNGESQQLDFKYEISDARKMAKTFSAFANTDGGRLLIGVKDNGRISGIRSEEEAFMAESSAHLYCKPLVDYSLRKWIIDGKPILEIEVPPSRQKPHYARNEQNQWVAYVRVNDQNFAANAVLINYWKMQHQRKGIYMSLGNAEKALMEHLAGHGSVTLRDVMRIARIGRNSAENMLVNLMGMRIIDIQVTELSVTYHLSRKILTEREMLNQSDKKA